MGTLPAWELAALISSESGRPIHVIAPPPRLASWVNNKVRFSELVRRLFGDRFVPNTRSAGNFATLSKHVNNSPVNRRQSVSSWRIPRVAVELWYWIPGSTHHGIWGDIYEELMDALRVVHWDGRKELLIDSWETNILGCPSSQLWIPPIDDGKPVVEGIFAQAIEGQVGVFVGSAPAKLPDHLMQEISNRSWLLARIFSAAGIRWQVLIRYAAGGPIFGRLPARVHRMQRALGWDLCTDDADEPSVRRIGRDSLT